MARVIWAPKALADLEALLDYIGRDAPASASRFGEKILARVDSLAEFPDSGSFVPEDETQTYREVFQGNSASFSEPRRIWCSSSRSTTVPACYRPTDWIDARYG